MRNKAHIITLIFLTTIFMSLASPVTDYIDSSTPVPEYSILTEEDTPTVPIIPIFT